MHQLVRSLIVICASVAPAYADLPERPLPNLGLAGSEECGCSVEMLHGIRQHGMFDDFFDDPAISLGNNGRQVYLVIESFDHAAYGNGSLASSLLGYFADKRVSPRSAVSYLEINGLPAASVEFKRRYEESGGSRNRVVAVDAGDQLIIMTGISKASLWWDNKDRLDDVMMSLMVNSPATVEALHTWPDVVDEQPLLDARTSYVTETLPPRFQRRLNRPPEGTPYERTKYLVGEEELDIYRSIHASSLAPGAAVIWVPEATTTDPGKEIWERPEDSTASAEVFLDNGLRVFVPSFRGMADNPGEHEFFLGEVDDLLAAIDFVKSSDGVDPDRVYLAGFGHGGTLAMLAAVAGAEVRASFTYDGWASMREIMAGGGFAQQPFAVFDEQASYYRSPIHWADRLRAPLFYVADDSRPHNAEDRMAELSLAGESHMVVVPAPFSDRVNTVASVVDVWVFQIQEDDGPLVDIRFDERDLYDAAIARYGRKAFSTR